MLDLHWIHRPTVEKAFSDLALRVFSFHQPFSARKRLKTLSHKVFCQKNFIWKPQLTSNLKPGDVFGLLTLYSTSIRKTKTRSLRVWDCTCRCGAAKVIQEQNLKSGATQSCGCLRLAHRRKETHGMSRHPAYKAYISMLRACRDYKRTARVDPRTLKGYRQRPIQVWPDVSTFELFWAALGPSWFPGAKLTRIYPQSVIDQTGHDDEIAAMRVDNLQWT